MSVMGDYKPLAALPAFQFGNDGVNEIVAIVGGGGKTSLMFALAKAAGQGALTSTTTRIFQSQMKLAHRVVFADDLTPLDDAIAQFGTALVAGALGENEKTLGVSPELPAQLLVRPDVRHLIVEADGSRMRPCKAPAAHEPVIPDGATLVIPVAGIDALGQPILLAAHRPRLVAQLTGQSVEGVVSIETLSILLSHRDGGLKNAPPSARVIPFLNKVETKEQWQHAMEIAGNIIKAQSKIKRVVFGSVQKGEFWAIA